MKILYIDHHAALPSSGGDCRAVQLAQGWQQCGDEVTIVTAGYSHRRGKNLTVEKEMEEQQLEGVTFCPLLSPDYDHGVGEYRKSVQSFLKKLYLNAPKLVERYHPEIVIAASGYPYDYFCAQRIAKLAHAKTVFELRETWPELQRELYPAEDSRLNQCIAEYAMGYALRGADTVVSFLQKGEDYCRQRRSPRPTWPPCRRPLRRRHLPSPCGKPTLKRSGPCGSVIPLSPPTPGTSMTGICRSCWWARRATCGNRASRRSLPATAAISSCCAA